MTLGTPKQLFRFRPVPADQLCAQRTRRPEVPPAEAGGGWRKPDFQSVRGPSLGMPVGNCLLSARKTVMLTMPQAIDSEVPDPEEWMS